MLAGPAFSLSNAFAGLYFGKAADSKNRSRMLALACIAWSLTSVITGSVNSLLVLAIMRFVLGLFCAAAEPLIFNLIDDTIPKKNVPVANSMIKAASYAGSALSGISVIFISKLGWRSCSIAMGSLGMMFGSLALLTIKEPSRGAIRPEIISRDLDEIPKKDD